MPNNHSSRHHKLRQSIAAEAAKIIATEGQRSYLIAKQKAAERLGASTRNGLPSNAEVEAELRTWQHLFGGSELEARLDELRREAISAMRFLKPFRPRLVGPVAEGTADQYSRVCLQVFSDDPDEIPRYLMERQIDFDQERRKVRWHDGNPRHLDILVVDRGDALVELMLMVGRESLQPLPSPIDGRPQLRLAVSDVEELVSSQTNLEIPPPGR
ncbi:MAG: hypothetical protein AAGJ52_04145 [Pseudomonadota bacterium]